VVGRADPGAEKGSFFTADSGGRADRGAYAERRAVAGRSYNVCRQHAEAVVEGGGRVREAVGVLIMGGLMGMMER